jgi:hypothetical protein
MTLTRGQFLTYDFNRMVVMFTMMDGHEPRTISTRWRTLSGRRAVPRDHADRLSVVKRPVEHLARS